ncbi:MAG: hypothetical protein KatS3mg011_1637 [Acidimicrobiia bacterium]|nr:MAG: hypothetical protein KatS3mg011_1637 [Acidimicrobiia bacterium]
MGERRRLADFDLELEELLLLLSDGSAASLISACSRLRRLEAPAQARMAVAKALEAPDCDRRRALTTAGAAALDLGLVEMARRELEEAHSLDRESPYTTAALGRCALLSEDYDEAASWANQTVALGKPDSGWALMAAIARTVGDEEAFRNAITKAEEFAEEGLSSRWPLFVAGRLLVESGDPGGAEKIAAELRRRGEDNLANWLTDLISARSWKEDRPGGPLLSDRPPARRGQSPSGTARPPGHRGPDATDRCGLGEVDRAPPRTK